MSADKTPIGDAVEQELLRAEVWAESEQPEAKGPAVAQQSDLHTATIALSILGLVALVASLIMGSTLIFCLRRQFRGN